MVCYESVAGGQNIQDWFDSRVLTSVVQLEEEQTSDRGGSSKVLPNTTEKHTVMLFVPLAYPF